MANKYESFGKVKVGKGTIIEDGAILYGPLSIGNDCYIGRNAVIGYPTLGNVLKFVKKYGKIIEGGLETIIGNNVFIDKDVMIYEDSKIGDNAKIFHHASIREKVEIGQNSIIGCYSVIDGPDVKIGNNSFIHAQAYICSKTTIGNHVFIGPQAGTINEKTAQSRIGLTGQENYRDLEKGPMINDYASIGEGAKIMMGMIVGKKAVIGAGSVVTKNVPENEIWVGNPARKLKERNF